MIIYSGSFGQMSLHFKIHANNEMKAEHSALLPLGVLGASLLKDNRTGNKGELEHIERLTTFNCVNSLTFQHHSFSITVRKFQRFAGNSQFHHFSSSIWVLNIPISKPVKHHKIVYFSLCVCVCMCSLLFKLLIYSLGNISFNYQQASVYVSRACMWLLVWLTSGTCPDWITCVHKWGRQKPTKELL